MDGKGVDELDSVGVDRVKGCCKDSNSVIYVTVIKGDKHWCRQFIFWEAHWLGQDDSLPRRLCG
eukprot:15365504-Ditylum_brightwellii.AAC.1